MRGDGSANDPRKALVVGLGVSGQAVCELLLACGMDVAATDMRARDAFGDSLDGLEAKGCRLRLGEHRLEDFLGADQIIVSPGVPLEIEPLREAFRRGIEIVGELEWAWRRLDGKLPVVAVSGTNGKTTTTSLLGEIFKAAGKRVFVGGNIGTPLSRWLLRGEAADLLVLEVSSFQLDTARDFCPDVGVLLNVTEDHLDRYADFEAYIRSKFSLFARQNGTQTAIVNADDPVCRDRLSTVAGRILLYSRGEASASACIDDGRAVVRMPGCEPFALSLDRTPLKGVHNEENILAAALAAASMDVPADVVQSVIDTYGGLPHRVEWVRGLRGIDFYDDSKATNVGAVVKALENFDRPVLLLLGGRDKLGSYEPLTRPLRERGKEAFVFGEAAPRLLDALAGVLPVRAFGSLDPAFHAAVSAAQSGDVVLLSPACSSFDQYSSYAERGDHFKRLVAQLR